MEIASLNSRAPLRPKRDWLVECGVQVAAMESTSTYWKPPFYCLEQAVPGDFDVGHALLARSILRRIDQIQTALAELDQVIDVACETLVARDRPPAEDPGG